MSETPKKKTTKKAPIKSTVKTPGEDKPVANPKRTTTKKDTAEAVVSSGKTNPEVTFDVADETVTTDKVTLTFWARVKKFLLGA